MKQVACTVMKGAGLPDSAQMSEINKYTRRELSAEEVYVFSVLLCDNEIDRDNERFSIGTLKKLAELFKGKTGIFDHSMEGKNQTARIFLAGVEQDANRRTLAGEPYTMLKAYAYMPRTQKNEDLIQEIDAGIKKEVSVGCAVERVICSVCAQDMRGGACSHRKGTEYEGKKCHAILEEPSDAYEWSFVAVPAQRNAGVTKAFHKQTQKQASAEDIFAQLKSGEGLMQKELERFKSDYARLEEKAKYADECRGKLQESVRRLCVLALPALEADMLGEILKRFNTNELEGLKSALEEKVNSEFQGGRQLEGEFKGEKTDYSQFRI